MVRFHGGPADKVILQLRRAPFILRVVTGAQGEWDALDQLDDEPKPDEQIVVYRLLGHPQWVHIRASKPGMSGRFAIADYECLRDQPADHQMRSNAAWQEWCIANRQKLDPKGLTANATA